MTDEILGDTNYIMSVNPDWAYGRRHGLTDDQTSEMAEKVFSQMEIAHEKQRPKNPRVGTRKVIAGIDGAKCETCGGLIFDPHKYCHECGTAIDWSKM